MGREKGEKLREVNVRTIRRTLIGCRVISRQIKRGRKIKTHKIKYRKVRDMEVQVIRKEDVTYYTVTRVVHKKLKSVNIKNRDLQVKPRKFL